MIYIFDILGKHCGMHYYDAAFAEALKARGCQCCVYSNFRIGDTCTAYFPNFFSCGKILGICKLFVSYIRFTCFVLKHKNEKIVYLTFGELYELPFLFIVSLIRNGWIDIHEIHALKYKDDSFVSRLFEWFYKGFVHDVIYHSNRTYNILRDNNKMRMVYVPHFKYVFKKSYEESLLANDIKQCFTSSVPKLLFFGNLSMVKGIDVTIDVFTKLKSHEDFELVIAGKNIERLDFDSIRNDKMKIINRHINDDELVYLYSHTDYILLPYRKSSQSGIFAMAAYFHKPMILSNIPYFKRMMEEFPSFGIIGELDDFESLIRRVISCDTSNSFYNQIDCDKFENKEDIDCFVKEFSK